MRRVVLHIDRLVLTGFPREQREALVEGLREALGWHFAEPEMAARLAGLPSNQERLRASGVALGHGLPAAAVGARLGGGIARSLRR